jgi:hypothetical protein
MFDATAGNSDPVTRKYEQLWQQGELPSLHQFVAAQGLLTPDQLLAVVRVDMWQRWRRRQGLRAEVYLTNYPSLEDHPQGYRLVCEEVAGRRAMGEPVDVEALVRQFPQWADPLSAELSNASPEQDAAAWEKEALTVLLGEAAAAGGPEPTVPQSAPAPAPAPDMRPPAPAPPQAEAGALRVVGKGYRFNDRYRVEDELGQGGMGKVFLARDEQLGRRVAVKVIRPQDPRLLDSTRHREEFARAFMEEARIGADLDHPNIAKVFDFGIDHGEPFTVFEYVEGETLKGVLARRGRLPLEEVRDVVAAVAQGLAYAHERGVVHRDLKPANIRVTSQGQAKILDLGLAARFREQADWRYCGTPAYVAPEQVASHPCDGRTDQYALAVIAYELLTGELPFRGPDVGAVLDPARGQPPDPRRLLPDLPAPVAAAIQRGLAKQPAGRYDTCEEFATALGCQLVRRGADAPSFLRLAKLVAAGGGRLRASGRTAFSTTTESLFLALASDGLYAWYADEMTHWPLAEVCQASQRGASLTLQGNDGKKLEVFTFASKKVCAEFGKELEELLGSPQGRRGGGAAPSQERRSVVLLPNRICFRHQVLGTVSHEGKSKAAAQIGVQIQAHLLGADAVSDLELERLPTFFNTGYRCAGVAVRAVDREGRLQLGAFWLEKRAAALSVWILAALGIILALALRGVATSISRHPENLQGLAYWLGAAVVPAAGAVLLRTLRWPQLVLPATVSAVVYLIGMPVVGILGAADQFSNLGGWAMALTPLAILDPIPWTGLFSSIFLGLRTRQFLREYRQLLTTYQPEASLRRRVGGGIAWASVAAFALALLGFSGVIILEASGGLSLLSADALKARPAVASRPKPASVAQPAPVFVAPPAAPVGPPDADAQVAQPPAPPVGPPDTDFARKMAEKAAVERAAIDAAELTRKLEEEKLARKMAELDRLMEEITTQAAANPTDSAAVEPKCREAVDLLESLPATAAGDRKALTARMVVYLYLGNIRFMQDKPAEAEAFLAKAQPAADQLHKENPDKPDVTYMYGQQLATRGRVQVSLGKATEAEARLKEAVAVLRKLVADPQAAKPHWRMTLPIWLQWQADVYRQRSQWAEAAACLDEALEEQDKARQAVPNLPPEWQRQFREELLRDRRAMRTELAGAALNRAAGLQKEGKYPGALPPLEQARDLYAQLAGEEPREAKHRQSLGQCYHRLGEVQERLQDLTGAEEAYRQAVAVRAALVKTDSGNAEYRRDLALSHWAAGTLAYKGKRWAGAGDSFGAAVDLYDGLMKDDPRDASTRRNLAFGLDNLGLCAANRGQAEAAAAHYRRAAAEWQRLTAADPKNANDLGEEAWCLDRLARVLRTPKTRAEAEPVERQLVEVRRKALELARDRKAAQKELARACLAHAQTLESLRRWTDAATAYDGVIAFCAPEDQLDHRLWRARCLVLAGDREKAVNEVTSGPGMKTAETRGSLLLARVLGLAADRETNADKAKQYADAALAALREAVDRGFNNVASLKQLDDLKALRGRPDFQALVRELEGPSKK